MTLDPNSVLLAIGSAIGGAAAHRAAFVRLRRHVRQDIASVLRAELAPIVARLEVVERKQGISTPAVALAQTR